MWLAPLAAAAAVVAIVGGALAVSNSSSDDGAAGRPSTGESAPVIAPGKAVHVKLLNSDGTQYGVGMPVIAYFSKKITDGKAFQRATKATANGVPITGAWYFEASGQYPGFPVEAHFRPKAYWPAHEAIHITMPVAGKAAGKGLRFDNNLTLDFSTGARMVSVVDEATHLMKVTRDGSVIGKYPVSLGLKSTPTRAGTKVIMEKDQHFCITVTGKRKCDVQYGQRLTYSGEYLHAAPWNVKNIETRRDTSNGCTNLLPADAKRLFQTFELGDVVFYSTDGPTMSLSDGYGDWNVSWPQWQTGGLVPTR